MPDILFDVPINAPRYAVFAAIANPKEMVHWWPLRCTGEMKQGGVYNLFFSEEYDWYGEVSKFKEDESFSIKMTKADSDWVPTSFGYDLSDQQNSTRLSFFHKDWPENNHHYRKSGWCWAILLNGLKDYVENGIIIPFDQRA